MQVCRQRRIGIDISTGPFCTGLILAQGDLADGNHAERGGRLEYKEKQDKDYPRRLEIGIRTGTPPVAQITIESLFPMWYVEIFKHSGDMAFLHELGQSTYEWNKSGLQ